MDFYEEEVYEKYCEHTSAIASHFFSESLIIFSIIILDTRAFVVSRSIFAASVT